MHERLNSFPEFLAHPHAQAIGLVSWLEPEGPATPIPLANIAGIAPFAKGAARAAAPLLGQHTADVLREHGFTAGDIASLIERGIVAET